LIDVNTTFMAFNMSVFDYFSNNQTITITLIGILFLYFGYYSSLFQPVRTDKLDLYLSGFDFLTQYFIVQLVILYLFSEYLKSSNIVSGFLIFFIYAILYFIFSKISYKILLKIIVLVIVSGIVVYFIPKLMEYFLQNDYMNLIVNLFGLYYASFVIKSAKIKTTLNSYSYDYKDFFLKISKMKLTQYPILICPLRILQRNFFNSMLNRGEGDIYNRIISNFIPEHLFKIIGITYQKMIFKFETWFNSLIIFIFMYVLLSDENISLFWGLMIFIILFLSLTYVAREHSIYSEGFLLVEVSTKKNETFKCRLMKMDGKLITIIHDGSKINEEFNPIEYYPMDEIHKVKQISLLEMIDDM